MANPRQAITRIIYSKIPGLRTRPRYEKLSHPAIPLRQMPDLRGELIILQLKFQHGYRFQIGYCNKTHITHAGGNDESKSGR